MKTKNQKNLFAALSFLSAFAAWTVVICFVDVENIGPLDSRVGLSAINGAVRNLFGVHMSLYTVTDWLGLVPIGFAAGFAIIGLAQWIRRGRLLNVDRSIIALGVFYLVVIAIYLLFEIAVVNYRPVLIDGRLEASYPSSTTVLSISVMATSMIQLCGRIKKELFRRCAIIAISAFILFMVLGRLFSGVHWFSDIIGGILLSAGLVELYRYFK